MEIADEVRKIMALLMERPITEELAWTIKSIEGYEHLEIVNSQWVGFDRAWNEMTTGEEHGWVESQLIILMGGHVRSRKLGRIYPGDVTFVLSGDPTDIHHMREPDVAFVASANVVPTKKFIYRAPDLAIEIISPSQGLVELRLKIKEYLRFGTQQVWLVIPDTQEIELYLGDGTVTVYSVGDTILGGDLLPGFQLNIAALFEE